MVLSYRIRKRITSIMLSSFVFSTSVAGHCAGHFYNVSAAEGIIGAIAGNFTLWDLATTALGAAGFMIVNDDIQQTASTHLGGNQYTLDYLLQEGLIEVNEQPSYTWDWSGLKSLMSDWQNYADSRPLDRIRQAAIESGIDFDNLWIDTFKQFVEYGAIGVDKLTNTASATISDLSEWIGKAFDSNVAAETPLTVNSSLAGKTIHGYINQTNGVSNQFSYNPQAVKAFACNDSGIIRFYLANRLNQMSDYYEYWNNSWHSSSLNRKSYEQVTSLYASIFGSASVTVYGSLSACQTEMNTWINSVDDVILKSPDIFTPEGSAVYPSSGTWAPSPYLGGLDWPDAWLQPVPAGAWSPAIDDLLDAPALPAPGEAGDIWGGVFDPYITNDPAIDIPGDDVIPTVVPRPTTAAGEGTWEEPYAVVPANPIPSMEDGAGQLPNIGEFFPFCIPGDFVYIIKLLWSEDNVRTAPHIYLPLRIPSINFSYDIDIDFTPFDEAAELLRTLVLISFCIALAILTKNLIWS